MAVIPEGGEEAATADTESYRSRFISAMDDDFNTPQALSALFDLARDINRERDSGHNVGEMKKVFLELAGVLGLTLKATERKSADVAPFIELLIETRKSLRQAKQFQLADEIRAKLTGLGITLEDTAQGTVWRQK